MKKFSLTEWMQIMEQEVEGTVYISCIMNSVPYHDNTKRYNVYNEEGTFDETYDITLDGDGYIIDID